MAGLGGLHEAGFISEIEEEKKGPLSPEDEFIMGNNDDERVARQFEDDY